MKLPIHALMLVSCLAVLSGCDGSKTYRIKTETIRLDSLEQIVTVHDSLVKPVL